MLNWIIGWSLRHRFLVIVLTLAWAGGGARSVLHLPIDAFPDTTPVQVQISTVAPALGPVEVERQVTFAVESAISGLPRLENVRSVSKFGLSQVTATFEDGTDIYFARQLVSERLGTVELPHGIDRPEMGPVATSLGEVFHYIVTGKGENPPTLAELTTLHNWVIRPQLATVPGVAEVNTWGGRIRQLQVVVEPSRLIRFDLTLDDVVEALRSNNLSVGGGVLERAGEASIVQGVALTTTPEQVSQIVITARDGVPVRIRDVADVQEGHELRRGGVTANGQGEVVLGLGFMLMGENSHEVTRRLESRLEEIRRGLPDNVDVRVVYERTELVDRVIETVKENLLVGALLVIAVLFAFLGSVRAGLIVAMAIPLSMLFSFSAMLQAGISASLLSLGAIDFGLVVDSSVIMVENCVRRVGRERAAGLSRPIVEIVRDAAIEVRRPTMFGELIIMIVYLPILLLEGVEGKLFRPMALTVVFALAGSLILSLTLMPVLCSLFVPRRMKERENWLVRGLQWVYRPFIRFSLRFRVATVLFGAAMVGLGVLLALRLGTAFVPRLYEEAIAINTVRLAGVSLDESLRYGTRIEKLLLERFPDEIEEIWSRTGTAEVATDPMGLEVTDIFLQLRPREEWTGARTQPELTAQMAAVMDNLPGMRAIFTQPIEMRMNEMTAGIRSDVGVKIFGDDIDTLLSLAGQVQSIVESIPGSADVITEQVTGQPVFEVQVDQDAIARHGVSARHVLEIVEALGQVEVSEVRDGQRRFDLVVRLPERYRHDPDAVRDILVPTATGERIPLANLADIRETTGPSTINREWGKRRIVVQSNVRGRDLGSFVREVQERIGLDVPMPVGYYVAFGGQFEHLQRASHRLLIIIPLCLGAILVLLYLSTSSVRDALVVLTGAPFAALGGVAALHLAGLDFTISAAVGFIAVSGVSMLSGLVLVSTIRQKIDDGLAVDDAIEETRLIRLRPILMTGLVAALGFVPMALNTGVGAEVQRPLAVVVIGGIIADNVLTLLVLPALYSLLASPRRIEGSGWEEPAAAGEPAAVETAAGEAAAN
jgi:cobalt-zinc-cadmium resistance protein CzcA